MRIRRENLNGKLSEDHCEERGNENLRKRKVWHCEEEKSLKWKEEKRK